MWCIALLVDFFVSDYVSIYALRKCVFFISGKIRYSTEPPETYTKPAFLNTKIITDMNKVFDLEELLREEQAMLQGHLKFIGFIAKAPLTKTRIVWSCS